VIRSFALWFAATLAAACHTTSPEPGRTDPLPHPTVDAAAAPIIDDKSAQSRASEIFGPPAPFDIKYAHMPRSVLEYRYHQLLDNYKDQLRSIIDDKIASRHYEICELTEEDTLLVPTLGVPVDAIFALRRAEGSKLIVCRLDEKDLAPLPATVELRWLKNRIATVHRPLIDYR